ncbi:hypothetical protein V8J82_13740 [Gymnodinialimonas sp. 2305UL16-5]|uniref:hypothetical protein n=1 Tax=Gymnodinialimonas mytili TaxID=3126503 RepID=UPI0030B332BB
MTDIDRKSLSKPHEIHTRRFGRNAGTALCLVGFCAVVFGLTVAKIQDGGLMEAHDHQPRASVLPVTEGTDQ